MIIKYTVRMIALPIQFTLKRLIKTRLLTTPSAFGFWYKVKMDHNMQDF